MWIGCSGVRGRAGIGFMWVVRWVILCAVLLARPLGHIRASFVRVLRVGSFFVGSARGSHSLDYSFVGWLYVGCLLGIRSRDLTGLLSFCTVGRLYVFV
jgi:hypothetical protein